MILVSQVFQVLQELKDQKVEMEFQVLLDLKVCPVCLSKEKEVLQEIPVLLVFQVIGDLLALQDLVHQALLGKKVFRVFLVVQVHQVLQVLRENLVPQYQNQVLLGHLDLPVFLEIEDYQVILAYKDSKDGQAFQEQRAIQACLGLGFQAYQEKKVFQECLAPKVHQVLQAEQVVMDFQVNLALQDQREILDVVFQVHQVPQVYQE